MDKLALLSQEEVSGVVIPEGVSFDGSTDYLSRSTDFVGNIDSKTFTFSCWVYNSDNTNSQIYYYVGNGTTYYFQVSTPATGQIQIIAKNNSGTIIFNATSSLKSSKDTWCNILVSIDLTNTLNRSFYINDFLDNSVVWTTYTNDFIDFTQSESKAGRRYTASPFPFKGRLAHLFLAYEYIDLSIESNRRIFITSDGLPA